MQPIKEQPFSVALSNELTNKLNGYSGRISIFVHRYGTALHDFNHPLTVIIFKIIIPIILLFH